VADGVDATVERVQAAVAHADPDFGAREAARKQLIEREDAPRVHGTPRDEHIRTLVTFEVPQDPKPDKSRLGPRACAHRGGGRVTEQDAAVTTLLRLSA
jgi:hypothetical protein